ncbi:serine O-acetyltransferase [Granulibacter bethesdensis]|uniref:Serine acetyltransferase n=1 Tax=Granulibacter bethesdensis (strain ATCC BAA-1260 / CGDNIH1) TaxID=391165 RepID=Q0BPT2_GRABC|nr:serine O-acetyltransferase [Granulibacter bethesdensis]ABI63170.1 Serine acetyltransferase [Granulibacter bethesdensis CGDNIH1]AHJ65236.1 Serine acetyltransferase [Granulibacter bethesdensis CGDNIH4]AHJ67857.1 Serine acetyltransferase [Granulibacter bethesdensis]APH53048.1 Serine acetyltransferase [Granulibacter bethesdensis]APH58110.1 Serine acetyltransferase [Granulibacter bethesdensis]
MSPATAALCRRISAGSIHVEDVWFNLCREAREIALTDPAMAAGLERALLVHGCFPAALGALIAHKLGNAWIPADQLLGPIGDAYETDPSLVESAIIDLTAIRDRDPACPDLLTPFMFFKGFQALQAYRISHHLWTHGREHMARVFQSRMSECFAVDIHPAARLGHGILIDHATGLVIGETAVVEDDVSILQEVTLGGTGKETGDRHPKVRRGVLIGAGAKILGNVTIGEGAKIGAGSIVLDSVLPYTTVVGVPAHPVGPRNQGMPALTMDQTLPPPEYAI